MERCLNTRGRSIMLINVWGTGEVRTVILQSPSPSCRNVGPVSDGRPHLVWPVNANRPDNPIPDTSKSFSLLARFWHRPPRENDKDQDGAERAIRNRRSKGLQKRRMMPPLATTLCWLPELSATFRSGLPEKKSRTSPRRPMKRNSR
jgi:hypothetical protein